MKYNAFLITGIVVTAIITEVALMLGVPFWGLFVVILPMLFITQMYAAHMYNSRPSLAFEDVPMSGYQTRLDKLEMNRHYLFPLGFQKVDEFYLKLACDVVTYVHQHSSEPVYVCDYHFGKFSGIDLVTQFENGITLTTCTLRSGGTVPRPPKSLLQVFDKRGPEEILFYHQKAIEFIKSRGISPRHILTASFRDCFMQSLRQFYQNTRTPFWPMKFLYWQITGYAKVYARPIQEQYLAGTIKIF